MINVLYRWLRERQRPMGMNEKIKHGIFLKNKAMNSTKAEINVEHNKLQESM